MCLWKPHVDKLNSQHSTKYARDVIKGKLSGRKGKEPSTGQFVLVINAWELVVDPFTGEKFYAHLNTFHNQTEP